MFIIKECFTPPQNSMAEVMPRSREALRMSALQGIDVNIRPFDVYGIHKGNKNWRELPEELFVCKPD